jgi:hypothetical protein
MACCGDWWTPTLAMPSWSHAALGNLMMLPPNLTWYVMLLDRVLVWEYKLTRHGFNATKSIPVQR